GFAPQCVIFPEGAIFVSHNATSGQARCNTGMRSSMNNMFRLMQYLVAASLLLTWPALAAPPTGADFEMGGSGSEAGKFADLRDMTFDGKDNLYTLEGPKLTKDRDQSYPGNARVQKFDNSGKPLSQFPIVDEALGEND